MLLNFLQSEGFMHFVYHYQQAPSIIEENRPHEDWPHNGSIKFDNYSVRYRHGLDLVLKDISFNVTGSEKARL